MILNYVKNKALRVNTAIRDVLELLAQGEVLRAEVTIPRATIISTAAGGLYHANGVPLVADPGAGYVISLEKAIMIYTYGVAVFAGGGTLAINDNAGTALTGTVAATALTNAANSITSFNPLAAAGNALVANKGLNLKNATGAFTQASGTATGSIKVIVYYRKHAI